MNRKVHTLIGQLKRLAKNPPKNDSNCNKELEQILEPLRVEVRKKRWQIQRQQNYLSSVVGEIQNLKVQIQEKRLIQNLAGKIDRKDAKVYPNSVTEYCPKCQKNALIDKFPFYGKVTKTCQNCGYGNQVDMF